MHRLISSRVRHGTAAKAHSARDQRILATGDESAERFLWDNQIRGFGLRLRGGRATYVLQYRTAARKGRRVTLGDQAVLSAEQARDYARELLVQVRRGGDPAADKQAQRRIKQGKDTVAVIISEFMHRHVDANKLRSRDEIDRIFSKYVIPKWGAWQIHDVGRLDVTRLLDKIADKSPVMADRVLAAIRKLFNWHAVRDDRFNSPIRPGMARTKPRERARTRVLSDEKIRVIWSCLDQLGTYGALVRVLFLSAQRREEVAGLMLSDIDADDIWSIDAAKYKTKRPHFVPLPAEARHIISAQERVGRSELVFTTNGKTPFSGFSKAKRQLDQLVAANIRKQDKDGSTTPARPLPHWTLHDIRRTAKTLMQRAGVRPDISERVLKHVIPGVEGTYDRYDYLEEKRDALNRLAALIKRILDMNETNVIPIRAAARQSMRSEAVHAEAVASSAV
jgi:integrase